MATILDADILRRVALVTYTHTKRLDALDVFAAQLREHWPEIIKAKRWHVFCDHDDLSIYDWPPVADAQCWAYDEGVPYYAHFARCLDRVESEFVIYTQEDHFLLAPPWGDTLARYIRFLDAHKDYSFVRLMKTGALDDSNIILDYPGLHDIPADSCWLYAMQPTIWRKNRLHGLVYASQAMSVRDENAVCDYAQRAGIKGAYHLMGEPQRGLVHWDSGVFPAICTAIVKGAWNMSEYADELWPLLERHGIDASVRGSV